MTGKVDTTALLAELATELPRLPGGRVDFSAAARVPVLVCFVEFNGRILLLKRSARVRSYAGRWGAVSRLIDQERDFHELVLTELKAELGLNPQQVALIAVGEWYEFRDPELARTWRVYPVLARLAVAPRIEIDWEHSDFEWVSPERLGEFETVPMLEESLRRAIRAALA